MQQKVAPDRVLNLVAGMRRLNHTIESETSKKFREIQSLANDTRYAYSESYVRSAVYEIESLLRELQSLSESVTGQLDKKEAALKWTAEKYRKTEEESKAKLQKSGLPGGKRDLRDLFSGLLDAAKKNMVNNGDGPSKVGSFLSTLMGVLLEIQEAAFIERVQPFKDDPKISGLIEILKSGTPEEQQIARQQLGQIAFAFSEIARNQVAYDIYKTYGNVEYMQESSAIADAQRKKLLELGVSEEWYNPEVNLSGQYKDTPLSALRYNPLKNDYSPMPVEKQLQLVIELGLKNEAYREWAKAHYPEIEIAVKQAILAEQEAKRKAEEAARLAEEEASKNMFEKSWESFKEIGSDFYQGMVDRNDKKFDSFYNFGNYITSGAFDMVGGFVDGLQERGDKAFDSTYDFFNWITIGAVDTAIGAFNPDEPLSKEHWLNSLGVVATLFGARGAIVSKTEGVVLKPKGPVEVEKPRGVEGTRTTDDLDFKLWEEMRARGQIIIGPNGQRLMTVRELKSFKIEMNEIGIKVIPDKKERLLSDDVAAGFDPYIGRIVLRRNPTYLSAMHESYHARQWKELGKENYLKQSRLDREEYVYNEILKNKNKFSEAEVLYSMRYIYKVRFGEWPPLDWKGFIE